VRNESVGGDNPFVWKSKTTQEYLQRKRAMIFSLPGAFTPTCSTYQLPHYDKLFDDFKAKGIEAIFCISVNDVFVMNAWAKNLAVKNVELIPDGKGEFIRKWAC